VGRVIARLRAEHEADCAAKDRAIRRLLWMLAAMTAASVFILLGGGL
jgi:hypothetical protein